MHLLKNWPCLKINKSVLHYILEVFGLLKDEVSFHQIIEKLERLLDPEIKRVSPNSVLGSNEAGISIKSKFVSKYMKIEEKIEK